MIIKNFLNKIEFSKISLFLLLIIFITGLIKEYLIVYYLVIIHEFGHYLISYMFKYNISKIVLLPFGGYIKYDELIDKPLSKDFLIAIFGPIFQIIGYSILINLVSDNYIITIKNYHYSMLIFNLLPIIPLDGSKILNIILNKLFNYRLSYYLLSFISMISLLIFIYFFYDNFSYYMIIIFLISEIYFYIKYRKLFFNRFIYEKYLYINKYKKYYKVNNINKMKRNMKNLIKINNTYYNEKSAIKKIKGV